MYRDSIFEGWVWKRSRYLKRWRRRWFVLRKDRLMAFKNRGDVQATEVFETASIGHVFSADDFLQQPRIVGIRTRERDVFIACDFDADKQAWMHEISSIGRGRQSGAVPQLSHFFDPRSGKDDFR